MSLEMADFIKDLIQSNPEGTDPKSRGDDHLRLLKHVLQTQFSGFTQGIPITRTESDINNLMITGSYGLGGVSIGITETSAQLDANGCGWYTIVNEALGNLPTPTGNYYLLQHLGSPAGDMLQLANLIGTDTYYHRQRSGTTWSAWVREWNTRDLPPQSSLTDITNNPVSRAQSFGTGIAITVASFDVNTGFGLFNARWKSDTFVNKPGGASPTNWVLEWVCSNSTGSYGYQTFYDTNFQRRYTRNRVNNVWGGWAEIQGSPGLVTNPGYIPLGAINLHWGTATGLTDEQTATIVFAASNANGTVGGMAGVLGQGAVGSTFIELDCHTLLPGGMSVTCRTNGAGVVADIFWIAIGIR